MCAEGGWASITIIVQEGEVGNRAMTPFIGPESACGIGLTIAKTDKFVLVKMVTKIHCSGFTNKCTLN